MPGRRMNIPWHKLRRAIPGPSTLLTIVLAVGVGVYYYRPTPNQGMFDGTYLNGCCTKVVIRKGTFRTGQDKASIRIRFLKYSYIGELDRPVGPFFTKENNKISPSIVAFGNDGSFNIYDYKHSIFEFSNVNSDGQAKSEPRSR